MSLIWLIIIILLVLAIAGNPGFGYHRYGWGPSGLLGLLLVILLVLALFGKI